MNRRILRQLIREQIFILQKENITTTDLQTIDQYADKQLAPLDIDLTSRHFFDRLQDPRNIKPVSSAELIGFFKRLGQQRDKFVDFVSKYREVVAKDNRSNINIPFMNIANKVIAKTILRKPDFRSSSPAFQFERKHK